MKNKLLCASIVLLGSVSMLVGCQSTRSKAGVPASLSDSQTVEQIYEQFGKLPAIAAIGLVVDNIYSLPEDQWRVAKRDLQIGERLQVINVLNDSIASRAGLEPGDRIIQINGTYVPKTKDAVAFIVSQIAPGIDSSKPVVFLVIRGSTALELSTASS